MMRYVIATLLLVVCLAIGQAATAQAAQTIPYKVNFQGRLTDASGNPKANGLYNIRFRLFSVANGSAAVWTETRETTNRVQVTNGLFSVQLGDVTALSPAIFTNYPLYLEVELPTPATATCSTAACASWLEGAMTPRSPLGAAPYAFNADTVDGLDGASLAQLGANNTFSGNNVFNGTTNATGNIMISSSGGLGFNMYHNGSSPVLHDTGAGSWLTQTNSGLRINTAAWGSADTSSGFERPTMTFLHNGIYDAVIDGGLIEGGNLLSNPGFEFSKNGWDQQVNISTASPHSGKAHYRFNMANSTSSEDVAGRMVAARSGDKFYAQAYLKTSVTTTGEGGLYFTFYDADGNSLSFANSDWTNPGTSYVLRSLTATAPANTAYVSVATTVRGSGATTGGTWDFDDIFLQKINASQPMALQNTVNSTEAFGIRSASGALLLAADTTNMALLVGGGDNSADDTPALLVVDNKSGSGDPTGRNGAIYYNADSKKTRCYEDGAWADCVSTVDARRKFYYANDLMSTSSFSTDGVLATSITGTYGSGMPQASITGRPGVVRMSVGFVNNANAGYVSQAGLLEFGQYGWQLNLAVKPQDASSSSNGGYIRAGFTESVAADPSNGCYARYYYNQNSGRWQGVCRNGGTESVCDTGVAVSAGSWYNIGITVNSSGTSVLFNVNGSTCAITANIPTANRVGMGLGVRRTVANFTGAFAADFDYIEAYSSTPISR